MPRGGAAPGNAARYKTACSLGRNARVGYGPLYDDDNLCRGREERIIHDGVDAFGAVQSSPVLQVTMRREETIGASQTSLSVEQGRANTPGALVDAYPMVRDLWWCEHILESEHREWLRLMYETEWFG